jgi:hypothetical protein
VPFLFLSGYGGVEVLPPRFRSRPFVPKPFQDAELLALMGAEFAAGPSGRTRDLPKAEHRIPPTAARRSAPGEPFVPPSEPF